MRTEEAEGRLSETEDKIMEGDETEKKKRERQGKKVHLNKS